MFGPIVMMTFRGSSCHCFFFFLVAGCVLADAFQYHQHSILHRPNKMITTTTKTTRPTSTSLFFDPMMGASDATTQSKGGCPFLDKSVNVGIYDVPALFSEQDSRPIVLFDGSCNLCNAAVQKLLKYDSCKTDPRGNLRFAALQSRVGDLLCRRMTEETRAEVLYESNNNDDDDDDAEKYKSIVVCTPNKTYTKSGAALMIGRALGGRLKILRYLSLMAYAVPTKARDRVYRFVSKRRRKWFGSTTECLLWDDRFDERFVDDGVLTGNFRDPFADPNAESTKPPPQPTSPPTRNLGLFNGESPPVRGDKIRIVWPDDATEDPSVTYIEDTHPDGVCLVGGTATIATIDLPMRVVVRVDRDSLGMEPDEKAGEGEDPDTVYAWVKPAEVAALA